MPWRSGLSASLPARSLRKSRALFVDHLEELRRLLLISLAAIGACSVAASFFSKPLLDFLSLPLQGFEGARLYFHTPYEAFLTHLKVILLTGFLLASPVFFTELWLFIAPGLYRGERRVLFPLILVSLVLFLGGAAFGFGVLVPAGLRFLLGFQTELIRPLLGIGPYFSFLIGMILACGIVFDLPVVVLGLVRAGVLGPPALRRARKGVIVFLFLLAAILTPSPDPVGQILLALPLALLYEACVWLAKGVEKRK